MRQASKRIPESAEKTVRDIRRATRRHHSTEQKIRVVLEGLRGEDSIAELCRKEGINQNLYYRWSKEAASAGHAGHPATTFCLNRNRNSPPNRSGGGVMGATVGRLWAWTFAVAALSLLGAAFGTPAWAQPHRSEPPPASPPNTLTGDWGGLLSYLDSNCVTITLNYTNDFLANVRGGIGPGAVGIGVFQPQLDLDLNKLVGWEGGKFHTHGLITHGPLFSPAHLNNILAVSNLEAGPVARLYSFWYEQNAFNDRLSVRAGLMSADSQFLQSQTAANFIN